MLYCTIHSILAVDAYAMLDYSMLYMYNDAPRRPFRRLCGPADILDLSQYSVCRLLISSQSGLSRLETYLGVIIQVRVDRVEPVFHFLLSLDHRLLLFCQSSQ
jgi:hypothetical protein